MSHMSSLETNARQAIAISVLNSFRHWLSNREDADFDNDDKELFLESVEMNQNPTLSPRMILNSFQGFINSERSATIQLSDALSSAIAVTFLEEERTTYLDRLHRILETMDRDVVTSPERERIEDLVLNAMQVISNETELHPFSAFTWKTI